MIKISNIPKKEVLYFSIVILILLYMSMTYPKHYTRKEMICISIGGIEKYHEFLKYENFKSYDESYIYNDPKERAKAKKNKRFIFTSFQNLKENMHAYNNNCKEFNSSEEKIIDDLFNNITNDMLTFIQTGDVKDSQLK